MKRSTKRWQEIERLYHRALEQEERRRAQFLEQACGGDEALRREVESLLAYQGPAAMELLEAQTRSTGATVCVRTTS